MVDGRDAARLVPRPAYVPRMRTGMRHQYRLSNGPRHGGVVSQPGNMRTTSALAASICAVDRR
jgi:hypothetical protein